MRLKDWLIPQDKVFFTLLTKEIAKVVKASDIFYQAIMKNNFDQRTVVKIKKLETECDQLVHQVFSRLNQTFITPLDHEDIGRLTIVCDDLLDLLYVISRRTHIYKINGQNKTLRRFARIVKKMIDEIATIIMKTDKLQQKILASHAQKIHQLENEADDLIVKSLERVFQQEDVKQLIKEKEIYELLEVLTDRIEDCCDLIQGVVTKNL